MNETDTKETDLALGDAEIASIIAVSKKAIYQKNQKAPARDTKNFNARNLVDLAFEAEKRKTSSTNEESSEDDLIKADLSDNANDDPKNENVISSDPPEPKDAEVTKLEDQIKKLEQEIVLQSESTELKIKLAEETGYSKGLSEGMTNTELKLKKELDEKIKTLENIILALSTKTGTDFSELSNTIEESIKRIAEERVQIELTENPELITSKIQRLAGMIVNATETPTIRLNCKDFELVQPLLNKIDENYKLIKDPNLSSGDAVLESGTIEIKDILNERLSSNSIEILTQETDKNLTATEDSPTPEGEVAKVEAEATEDSPTPEGEDNR